MTIDERVSAEPRQFRGGLSRQLTAAAEAQNVSIDLPTGFALRRF